MTEPHTMSPSSPSNRQKKSRARSPRNGRSSPQQQSGRSSPQPAGQQHFVSSSPRQPGPQPRAVGSSKASPRQPGPLQAGDLNKQGGEISPIPSPTAVGRVQPSRKDSGHQRGNESPKQGSGTRSPPGESGSKQLPKEYRHGHVPKNVNLEEEYKNEEQKAITTLMIRNIPNRYTQRELIAELEDLGFASSFDFLYIPLDKGTMSNVGYAFVNFIHEEWAQKCLQAFQNYRFRRHRKTSGKIAAVSVAHLQGLEANLAHYENAAVNTAKLKQRRPVVMANISKNLSMALGAED
eukprot:TRINITY_DN42280_c0_g1_i1.p1 TRINITY_DN42280_c0_g1~~TRINITY_DN42280_c0_g1_i1.p1  ORF type:complete len:324 (-),score=58.91 TRINITY_DN42280_c0_g1_i1:120-998(-)